MTYLHEWRNSRCKYCNEIKLYEDRENPGYGNENDHCPKNPSSIVFEQNQRSAEELASG